ncbi:hypothetical protein PV325_009287 [Microctonus aethiopoides]|nr:hypothetical protein PV325_009287 [Microctonus aethiopoides]
MLSLEAKTPLGPLIIMFDSCNFVFSSSADISSVLCICWNGFTYICSKGAVSISSLTRSRFLDSTDTSIVPAPGKLVAEKDEKVVDLSIRGERRIRASLNIDTPPDAVHHSFERV